MNIVKKIAVMLFLLSGVLTTCEKDTDNFPKLRAWVAENDYLPIDGDIVGWINEWYTNSKKMKHKSHCTLDIKYIIFEEQAHLSIFNKKVEALKNLEIIIGKPIISACFLAKNSAVLLDSSPPIPFTPSSTNFELVSGVERIKIHLNTGYELLKVDQARGFFPKEISPIVFRENANNLGVTILNYLNIEYKNLFNIELANCVDHTKIEACYAENVKWHFLKLGDELERFITEQPYHNSPHIKLPKDEESLIYDIVQSPDSLAQTLEKLKEVYHKEVQKAKLKKNKPAKRTANKVRKQGARGKPARNSSLSSSSDGKP